ncbi:hypothetical protein [Niabella drilacis]|uniref:Uncharacterized protein n=1 Tax=Niabella drilacis (strain DSM 25811 / CCM 8410 / CCUG 62505 / LMG 26954 / E90) TaxID=1285928 RepID=A0A1G6RZ76_NIADE|nr:hypothetical protein [Niabella drilacis]SDD09858.1 hypothetical protein SAMN04487894_10616 [Niabella drilacis]
MQTSLEKAPFQQRTIEYFTKKSQEAKGKEKLLVALEMSKYITAAREHGLSFDELREAGFRFATV